MKRSILFILCAFMLMSFVGCARETVKAPLQMYYVRKDYSYNSEASVLAPLITEKSNYPTLHIMLSAYLRGPADSSLESVFPADMYLVSVERKPHLVTVILSDSFADLTGAKLSLACCALAKTVIAYTKVDTVQIQAKTALLDGESFLLIRDSDIMLFDSYEIPPDTAGGGG